MHDDAYPSAYEADADLAGFSVVAPEVCGGQVFVQKDLPRVPEVDPVLESYSCMYETSIQHGGKSFLGGV